jgi:hypothetical protein
MASVQASTTMSEQAATRPRSLNVARALLVPATMIVILAVALLLLMTPIWMHFALGATSEVDCYATVGPNCFALSDGTVSEIFLGPGTFSSFPADEAAHMRDVRVVFWGFMVLALASVGLIAWQIARHPRDSLVWRSISRGGIALVVALIVVGVFAFVAFDTVFTLFHEIFFPGGNWAFPADSLLIRLYPYAFWELSSAALGVLGIGGGLAVWFLARRRANRLATTAA